VVGDRSVAGEVQVIIRQPGEECQEPPPCPSAKMMFLEKVGVLLGGNGHRTCDYVQI
jgi:hypothetical protein